LTNDRDNANLVLGEVSCDYLYSLRRP